MDNLLIFSLQDNKIFAKLIKKLKINFSSFIYNQLIIF